MNPALSLEVAETIQLAINGISLILLVALVPAIIGMLIFAIGHLIENQRG